MQRIIAPIQIGDRGTTVVNLQDVLQLFLDRGLLLADEEEARRELSAELQQERAEQVYRGATAKLVGRFQAEQRLEPRSTDNVDDSTAKAINAILNERGLLEQPNQSNAETFFVVSGQVQQDDERPFKDGLVRAFHDSDQGTIRLGEDTTDSQGRYTIRYALLPTVNSVTLRVVISDDELNLFQSSDIIRDARPIEIVNLLVPSVRTTIFHVTGKVSSPISAGVGELRVHIVDKMVGEDITLAETATHEDGTYQTTFTDTNLRQRGKMQPDLQTRIFAGDRFLAASEVRYNATTRETLNVLLDENITSSLQSEHETLIGNLFPHFQGSLRDLQETDTRQDITYLANKTGWDARAVAIAALADQFSARTQEANGAAQIEPAFFYTLFRAGLPANENALYQVDAQTAVAVWKQGIQQGVIPAALEARLPQALERFQSLAAQRTLDAPALVGVSSLKEMLTSSLGDNPEQQQQFANLYTQHKGDLPKFWEAVRGNFGEATEKRLRLDGQLGYLTLNNAPLMQKLQTAIGQNGITDTLNLAESGYYRSEKWHELITDGVAIPPEIPGANTQEKQDNYAELMSAQVRLSFPTAVVAQMVKNGETPLKNDLGDQVHALLMEQHGKFEIGMQPFEQYAARNNLQLTPEVTQEITRIQRVYQITPSNEAMNSLLSKGLDSAYAVVRYDQDEFVQTFKDELGGEANALLTYAKSQQVHNIVLNIATSYLTASNAPGIGVHSPAQIVDPAPTGPNPEAANAGDVIAYPTLENLFGEMDYCSCEHCRSILSPAAYLVDLLQFIDLRRYDSQGNELPPTYIPENPQDVLFQRRPDIQHLPLTCENTNIPLPYIDLVNETLEYFVTNNLKLENYTGHDTDSNATSEELLATPQFVSDKAYQTLAGKPLQAGDPLPLLPPTPPLPFHQSLENLRRYLNQFEAPLPKVMEALRKNDDLERANEGEYGWRDILMEELRISRAEYVFLTDRTLTLQQLYGYDPALPEAVMLPALSNAKTFTRRVGISYEEIVEILKTRFINPNSILIPKLERLRVSFATLKAFKDGVIADADFDKVIADANFDAPLPPELEASQYGGDIKAWVRNDANYANIMGLITLTNPTAVADLCRFDQLEFRYAKPDNSTNQVRPFEFVRLIRFIRLWKKLGWTIEQTDKAIAALYPVDQTPNDPDDAINLQKLDVGFLTLLPRLGIIKQVMDTLNLKPKKDLLSLLACFAPIDTYGISLYRQMFFSPALLKQNAVFADDGFGNFFQFFQKVEVPYSHTQSSLEQAILDAGSSQIAYDDSRKQLAYTGILSTVTRDALQAVPGVTPAFQKAIDALYSAQRLFNNETLRAALSLTDEEFSSIATALGYDANTLLTLDNISSIFRRGWLARILKLSVREFLLLTQFTGFDPFAAPDPSHPPIQRFIKLVHHLRALSLKPVQVLYPIWNQDISGKSVPGDSEILEFARSLRAALTAIESEYTLTEDPDGQIARSRMALVYGNAATDLFFGLLGNTLVSTVEYSHSQAALEAAIANAAPGQIAYDDFRKQLSFTGILTSVMQDALKAVPSVSSQFQKAVNDLYAENQKIIQPFFARYPELRPLYDAYTFFGQLVTAIDYTHTQPALETTILNSALGRIAYDSDREQLSFMGVLSEITRNALKAVPEVTLQFQSAVDSLYSNNQTVIQNFFTRYPEIALRQESYLTANDSVERRRKVLLENFLPELKRRRKRQQVLQSISAATTVEAEFANALLDNATVLHAADVPTQPALNDLMALETPGLLAQFFFRDTATEGIDLTREAEANLSYSTTGRNPLPTNPVPDSAISGIWKGYLEAPENDFYNLSIEADAGATVTLMLNGKKIEPTQNSTLWRNDQPIDLRAGTLYAITLTVEKVKDTLTVRWQTTGRGWEVIPSPYLYPATLTDHLRTAYIRFLKVTSLATALKLTASEIAYLTAHTDYQISGQGWLNSLPVAGSPDNTTSTALLKAFNGLLDFAHIKAELTPEDERLLTILKDPATAIPSANSLPYSLLFSLTRWESSSLNALLTRFGLAIADLTHLQTFQRIFDAYAPIKALGIPASALLKSATNEPNAMLVRDLQSALRARYNESDWLKVLKPINDEMRGLQRDALVAYILHQMRQNDKTKHIDTPDKLFEYFLMDVQMEPCMQTSRIRHALSSVQLFIERCLMNLETGVSPSSIKAKQWSWMKRYRVWEANRKVFLYPENWLEPELRDDQSPFFKEAMSELLQGDITEDRAAVALLNYLSKLEEVAKLEPCGIHYVENDLGTADDIAHVVARTAGANRKYFYRHREYGSWTPWEQIKLDIEDNPVLPVVWKDRLFLFWLRILKQAPLTAQKPGKQGQGLTSLTTDDINPDINITVQAVLCWSEYYNGKWQPTKTSDVNRPNYLGQFRPNDFDRSKLQLSAMESPFGSLGVYIDGQGGSSFLLYNSHSLPEDRGFLGGEYRPPCFPNTSSNLLTITYWEFSGPSITQLLLKNLQDAHTIQPQHPLQNPREAPFFYEDSRHVFYVSTSTLPVTISEFVGFGVVADPPKQAFKIPPIVYELEPVLPYKRGTDPVIIGQQLGVINSAPIERFVSEDAYIKKGIGTTGTVRYGDKELGPAGVLSNQ